VHLQVLALFGRPVGRLAALKASGWMDFEGEVADDVLDLACLDALAIELGVRLTNVPATWLTIFSGFPGTVAHAGKALEVSILSPQRGIVEPRRGEDHAVGHGEPRVEAEAGCGHGESSVEIDDRALLHDRNGAQRVPLRPAAGAHA
jgi:hypothetical protein